MPGNGQDSGSHMGSSNPPSSLLVSLADPGPWPVRTALRRARRMALPWCLTGSHPALPRPAAQSHLPRVGPSHGFINYHALHCVSDDELLCCMDHKIHREYKQRSSAVFQQEKKMSLGFGRIVESKKKKTNKQMLTCFRDPGRWHT